MGDRPLEVTSTSAHKSNQPGAKPRREQLAYLTRSKKTARYIRTTILVPGYWDQIVRSSDRQLVQNPKQKPPSIENNPHTMYICTLYIHIKYDLPQISE